MAVPKYNEMYLDYLQSLADGQPRSNREIRDIVSQKRRLTSADLAETIPSGRVGLFMDRLSWTGLFLMKAGLIDRVKRGVYVITSEGKKVLQENPSGFDNDLLRTYPSFQAWDTASKGASGESGAGVSAAKKAEDTTPEEAIDNAVRELNSVLADQLMDEIMARDSDFFEALVVKLLLKMGYGGSTSDSGFVTQKTNDGGIDGVIREDKLGFDQIYIQAKRWDPETSVSRPEIQKFSGALQEVKASKGLFITTAKFSDGAKSSAEKQRIVLVDGRQLTRLMIEYGLGVSTVATYEIKRLDSDFFIDDE